MTLKQRQIQKTHLAVMLSVIAVIASAAALITNEQIRTNTVMEDDLAGRNVGASMMANARSGEEPPLPFKLIVNGKEEPSVIQVKKGTTTSIDVSVKRLLANHVGDIKITSAFPECGTIDVGIKCTPTGITFALPDMKATNDKNTQLSVTVPRDMPTGLYPYQIQVNSKVKTPDQDSLVNVGYTAVFGIEVIE